MSGELIDDCTAEFEKFARKHYGAAHFAKKYTGEYDSMPVSLMFKAWKAAWELQDARVKGAMA